MEYCSHSMYQLNNENREANVVVMIMNKLDIKKVKKGKKALSSETGEFKKKKNGHSSGVKAK